MHATAIGKVAASRFPEVVTVVRVCARRCRVPPPARGEHATSVLKTARLATIRGAVRMWASHRVSDFLTADHSRTRLSWIHLALRISGAGSTGAQVAVSRECLRG
jgi:hypothetical protein